MNELLVPLDGSSFGEHALALALALAARAGGSVRLLHVESPHVRASPDQARTLRGWAEEYLEDVAERARAAADVPVEAVLLEGQVPETLLRHVQDTRPDLVLMTTHGRGPLDRMWLGSVADALVRRCRAPVLLVRPRGAGAPDLGDASLFRRIVVPLDGSDRADDALGPARELARLGGGRLGLVRVAEVPVIPFVPEGVVTPDVGREDEEKVRRELEAAAERLRADGFEVDTHTTAHESPARAILEWAETWGADLVVLATRGQGRLKRTLLGSVADKLVRAGDLPVLVVTRDDAG